MKPDGFIFGDKTRDTISEALRVYIGSFWDKPYENDDNAKLFEAEQRDLVEDLLALPRNSAVRKINELVKRAREVRTHANIMAHLQKKNAHVFRKRKYTKRTHSKFGK